MNNSDQITQMLTLLLIVMVVILVILVIVYFVIKLKNKTKNTSKSKIENNKGKKTSVQGATSYNKQSIFKFMEFDRVVDNMISQKNGAKYLMVIECQGINYDLMSEDEKVSVEESFLQFLNTLRHPIQIYTQTRTINLENSINTYKQRITEIEEELNKKEAAYKAKVASGNYSTEILEKEFYEMTKQRNLYEYGKDVIYNTEAMSLNRNVLNKKYYIIVPYHTGDLGINETFDKDEIKNLTFAELYTRSQAIIRTLAACGINARIMSSNDLVDLLYVSYNRDESELFGLDRALAAGYDELYSTAPDVLDRRMRELNKKIEEKAVEKANEAIMQVKSEKQKKIEQKQADIDDIINQLAQEILIENQTYVGEDIARGAVDKIRNSKKKKVSKQPKEDNEEQKKEEEKKPRKRVTKKSSTKEKEESKDVVQEKTKTRRKSTRTE